MDPRSIRASDDDRERVVAALREQTAQGRLTLEEFEERMGAAYAAKTWDDLRPLTRDLPVEVSFGKGGEQGARHAVPERLHERVSRYGPPANWLPRLAPALLLVSVAAVVAAVAGGAEGFPLLLIAAFWVFCGRGCRPRSPRRRHGHPGETPVHHT